MLIEKLSHPNQLEVFRKSFDPVPSAGFHWSYDQFQKECLSKESWLLLSESTPRAIACFLNSGDAFELVLCLTRREDRGRAYMRQLLQNLIDGPLSGAPLFLEVHEENIPAQKLYHHLGFKEISRRKAYYKDGKSALILQYVP